MPELSVIVPVYNVEKYLNRCIDSILSQTYSDIEIILVDDGSTDNSGNICDRYAQIDNRIRVFHKNNSGVSSARNIGIENSIGKYVAFVDSDDEIDSTIYQKLIKALKDTDADISFCRFYRFYDTGNPMLCYEENLEAFGQNPKLIDKFLIEGKYQKKDGTLYQDNVFGSVWRSIFKKEIIIKHNIGFDVKVTLAEDLLFMMDYCQYCKIGTVVNEYLYHYYIGREASAISGYQGGYRNEYFYRNKIAMQKKESLIIANSQYTDAQKGNLICYIRYRFVFDCLYNELVFNPDATRVLKKLSTDAYFKILISRNTFNVMKSYGESVKKIAVLMLVKMRMWRILQLIFMKTYKIR